MISFLRSVTTEKSLLLLAETQSLRHLHLRLRSNTAGADRTRSMQLTAADAQSQTQVQVQEQSEVRTHAASLFSPRLMSLCESGAFVHVEDLTVYSCDSEIVCASMLRLLGKRLKQLKVLGNSPRSLMSLLLGELCPCLEILHIEGAVDLDSLRAYRNPALQELRLVDSGALCKQLQKTSLPALRSFASVDFSHDLATYGAREDLENFLFSLPQSQLVDLELCVRSRLTNEALVLIGQKLKNLESLHLHLIDDVEPAEDISRFALQHLQEGCPRLETLRLTDGLVGFAEGAFNVLGSFDRLRCVYHDYILTAIPRLISLVYMHLHYNKNCGSFIRRASGRVP